MNKLFFCYFFFIINFTFAQSNYYETLNNEFIKCKSNSKNNFEFCDCCNSSFKQLDIALNKVYKQTINRLPNDSLKIYYKKAQIQWINFANNEIKSRKYFASRVDGTIRGSLYCCVEVDIWLKRLKELETYLNEFDEYGIN